MRNHTHDGTIHEMTKTLTFLFPDPEERVCYLLIVLSDNSLKEFMRLKATLERDKELYGWRTLQEHSAQ